MRNTENSHDNGSQLQSLGNLLRSGVSQLFGGALNSTPTSTAGNHQHRRISEAGMRELQDLGDPDGHMQVESIDLADPRAEQVECCCARECSMPDNSLLGMVCDLCGGKYHQGCGYRVEEADLSDPEVAQDFAKIKNWCGCDLHLDSHGCAPEIPRSSVVPGTVDKPAAYLSSREELWSQVECRAGGTVRLLCEDHHQCIALVTLPFDLDGFGGKFHHKVLPNDMCKVFFVNVTEHGKVCGQTLWMNDGDQVLAGTTKLADDVLEGTVLVVPVACIERHPDKLASGLAFHGPIGDEPAIVQVERCRPPTSMAEEQATANEAGVDEKWISSASRTTAGGC